MRELRAIDLLSGAGGWACAARGLPIRIVLAADLWDVCCRTYGLNHPQTELICGDVREVETQHRIFNSCEGHIDLVLGAIPCEWLSVRRRLGRLNAVTDAERDRERATLSAVLDLVKLLEPAYWCLEDVVGLADELPEGTPSIRLDSADFSAQRRKRLYVGEFPAPILSPDVHRDGLRLRDKLRAGPFRIGRRAADRELVSANAFAPDKVYAANPDRKSPTICAFGSRRDAELVIVDEDLAGGRRQIEWQEGAALQGFPEDYVFYGSPGDVWKMIGQAIQIDTGRAILEQIVNDRRARPEPLVTPEARSPQR